MKRFVLSLAASAAVIALAPAANAAIVIGVGFNGNAPTQMYTDGGTGTFNYNLTTGGYSFTLIGTGSPVQTEPDLVTLALAFSQSNNAPGGSVQLYITETDLSSFTGSLLSTFNSNTLTGNLASATISSYYDAGNGLFGGTLLQSHTFNGLGVFAGMDAISVAGPFSETVLYNLSAGPGAATFNGTANLAGTAVPEPATWGLMLLGFGAMGGMLRTRRQTPRVRFA